MRAIALTVTPVSPRVGFIFASVDSAIFSLVRRGISPERPRKFSDGLRRERKLPGGRLSAGTQQDLCLALQITTMLILLSARRRDMLAKGGSERQKVFILQRISFHFE
jgi:hypothetical protein